MEKNIYDMLNEVEIDLNEYDRENLTDIEKRKFKNNFKKSINKKNFMFKKGVAVASIVLLTVGLFGTNLGVDAWAYTSNIANNIANYLGIEKSLDEYKTIINKPITKNGITIKLNEVILDNNQLIVSTTLKSNEKLGDDLMLCFGNVYVNGKKASSGAGGSSKIIDEYTIEEVMTYYLQGEFNGDLNIKLAFSDIVINGDKKRGRYVFNFKTNGDELVKDTEVILLNNSFKLENGQKVTLEKYTSNNLGQRIYFSKDSKGTNYDMVLRGHDDLGNEVEFYMATSDYRSGVFKLSNIHGNLNEKAKELILTPYAVKFPEKSGRLSHDFKTVGKEFKIKLSK